MSDKILFVDDDENLLESFRRTLRKQFVVETAVGGRTGLDLLQTQGPFAVVVSDMRMPELDGVQFLAQVRTLAPDSIRIMLTGQADLQDAVAAVNEGNIFRFLTKPCGDNLVKTLEAALAQYHLILAERELLEKTLSGSIKVLTDILSLVNPEAFSRSDRLKRYVHHICEQLHLPDAWQYELAAMLSQIGCVTLPPDTVRKYYSNLSMSREEQSMIAALPNVSADLLANIPRLESVAQMIRGQQDGPASADDLNFHASAELGAKILTVASHYDQRISRDFATHSQVIEELLQNPDQYEPTLVQALHTLIPDEKKLERRCVSVFDLNPSMIFDEDLKTKKDLLLVAKGQSVSPTLIKSLINYVTRHDLEEKVNVLVFL